MALVGVLDGGGRPSAFQDVGALAAGATSPRGFPGAAKRATIAGMSWHHIPKDDAWKQAHLAMLARLGKRAWLHCDGCRQSIMIEPHELARQHRLDMLTPLFTISKAMRCTRCGARMGAAGPSRTTHAAATKNAPSDEHAGPNRSDHPYRQPRRSFGKTFSTSHIRQRSARFGDLGALVASVSVFLDIQRPGEVASFTSQPTTSAPTRTEHRQRAAIASFAKRANLEIVGELYDAAVSGADPIEQRPGFAAMLEKIEGNGIRTIIVETASRFARDLMVQEVGYERLRNRTVGKGKDAKPDPIHLIAADSPAAFLDDGPTSKLIRQVLGAVELAELGHVNVNGRPYSAKSVRSMIRGARPVSSSL